MNRVVERNADDWTDIIQEAIDTGGPVVLPARNLRTTAPLRIRNHAWVRGANRQASTWGRVPPDGTTTTIVCDHDGPGIIVGGDAESALTSNGYPYVEAVQVSDLTFRPAVGRTGGSIVIDGSNTRDATRGFVRDVVAERVATVGAAGGWLLDGNAFNVRLHQCVGRPASGRPYEARDSSSNIGISRPGQVYVYDSMFWSPAVGSPTTLLYTTMFGGHIQGHDGATLGYHSGLFGTHVEGEHSDGSVGIRVLDRSTLIFPETVGGWDTGVVVGDGSSAIADSYQGHIPLLIARNAGSTAGVRVTSGGSRVGSLRVARYQGTFTKQLDDQRGGNHHDPVGAGFWTSPDGTRWRLVVDDTGNVSAATI